MSPSDIGVFIDPFSYKQEQDRLFDAGHQPDASDDAFEPFAHLRAWLQERGVDVHTADLLDADRANGHPVKIFFSFGPRQRYTLLAGREDVLLSGFFAFECPVVLPTLYRDLHTVGGAFKRVFSFSTEEALRPFLRGPVRLTRFMLPLSFDDVHGGIWERRDRQFLTIVSGNKMTWVEGKELYTERLRAIEFFNRYREIDLYGRDWDGPPIRMATRLPRAVARLERRLKTSWESLRPPTDPLRVAAQQAFRGPTSHKADTLSRYTFAICYENQVVEGWITEKIFDCFFAGTIPIYWGAPDIDRWIPPECFIDMRQFQGYDDLRELLHSLNDDQIEAYRVAALDFVRSERFHPFTKHAFAELVGQVIEEDTGVSL
jgi:hypothetical protein